MEFAVVVKELDSRYHTLGFQAGVHRDGFAVDRNHHTRDDGSDVHLYRPETFLEKLRKILAH